MNRIKISNFKGFTLIELLVVISIIGLLSSVVLASVNTARAKARDSAIKQGVRQMATLMALNYNDYSSYAALQTGWISYDGGANARTCDNQFTNVSNPYNVQMRTICNSILPLIIDPNSDGQKFHTGINTAASVVVPRPTTSDTHFSIMARLSTGKYFCIGSSGRVSDQVTYDPVVTGPGGTTGWASPGCWGNP